MTVSRVIRGTHVVKEETAAKVREAVAKLGYHPDPALSALAAYRSKEGGGRGSVLAFLDCDRTPYSRVVLDGVRKEASLLGYSVERFLMPVSADRQKHLGRMLFYRGVRGLLFGPSDDLWSFTAWSWNEFAMVSLGAVPHRPAMHSVAMDYFDGAATARQLLRERGCRRIALVVDPKLENRTGHRWRGGFLSLEGPDKGLVYGKSPAELALLEKWVRSERVDGVLTIHDDVWRRLQRGKRDRMIQFAFLNDSCMRPAVPYLGLDRETIGAEGVRLLHHLLLRREYGLPESPKMVALRGEWKQVRLGSA